ncbi:uncharacterized protein EV420DRAFT_58081 [Desarmillaria tabescens]|uniref:RecQ-mediated genome instability protein 1 n=1 Tax=Armillaria tabescens TaxID=1929756 RepID=A0AA39NPZ4_ARMTA|nr:uncharacterized protein EV420DRAFT_58081 [Desarmillaria tabescens]KAK0469712.1 hypothetical protein EV420DRAFT_58081 [Desarmillaria tabescens]
MAVPRQVTQFIEKTYPRPRVDPEWLQACYNWVLEDKQLSPTTDMQQILKHVEEQLLCSNLQDSMLQGTGLPPDIANPDTQHTIVAGPVLVEIVSITDIGVSAYNLNKIRITREERIAAGEQEVGEGDVEVEGEGPIPAYTRSMLRMEISDGTTILRSMEYRPLKDVTLGETPLGCKLLLTQFHMRRGVALLEPKCVTIKGQMNEERNAFRDADFRRGLMLRLGHPEPEPEADADIETQELPVPLRSPLHGVNRPCSPTLVERNRMDEQHPRRRTPNQDRNNQSDSYPSSSTTAVNSSFFSASSSVPENRDLHNSLHLSPVGTSRTIVIDSDEEDNARPSRGVNGDASSEFGGEDFPVDGDELWAALDAVEAEHELKTQSTQNASSSKGRSTSTSDYTDIIMISDDEDDDKENFPAPTRRTQPRTANSDTHDVIELSD